MEAFNITRILKNGTITYFTVAKDADTAIKELGLKRYGAKNVKVNSATITQIEQHIENLNNVEIYEEFKKGELCVNEILKKQYLEALEILKRKVS